MRTLDLSPLFRHSVSFDRMQRLMNIANKWDSNAQTFTPYNIEQMDKNTYRIIIAVAGFSEKDLNITTKENTLSVTGNLDVETPQEVTYLHRGIAGRAFERRFEVAEHIKESGAGLTNGLLSIELVRDVTEEKNRAIFPYPAVP